MNTCRLIYKSIANSTVANNDALAELKHQAVFNNKKLDISGILFFSDNKFLQVLEGEPKYVRKLYSNISKDERHHDVELITYTVITKREYNYWDMRLVNLNKLDRRYQELLEKNTQLMIAQKCDDMIQAHREIKKILKEMKLSTEVY